MIKLTTKEEQTKFYAIFIDLQYGKPLHEVLPIKNELEFDQFIKEAIQPHNCAHDVGILELDGTISILKFNEFKERYFKLHKQKSVIKELSNPISITIINQEARQESKIRLFDAAYYNSPEFPKHIIIKGLDYYGEALYSYQDIMLELSKKDIFIDEIFIQLLSGSNMCTFQTLLYCEGEMKNMAGLVPLPVNEWRSRYIFNRSLKADSKIVLDMMASTQINILLKIKTENQP